MLSLELTILIIALVGSGFLTLFTLLKNPNSHTNRLLFLFTLVIAFYNLFNYFISHQASNESTFFWIKMVMAVAVAINLLFYLLVATFPKTKLNLNRKYLFAAVIFTGVMIVLAQTNFVFSGVVRRDVNIESVPGAGMPLFLLHTIIFLGGGFLILVRKLRQSIGLEKAQIQLFLISTILLFVSILVTNLILPLIFNFTAFISLLPVYTLVFISLISYAIVRHRFLNINLLVARSVAYTALFLILGLLYASSILLVSNYFYSTSINTSQAFVFVLLALFTAFTLQPLRKLLEQVTDTLFFKGKYDSSELVFNLTKIMASTLLLEDLGKRTLHELLATMRISKGSFILFRENANMLIVNEGHDHPPSYNVDIIGKLFGLKRILIFEEEDDPDVKKYMQQLNIAVVLPLFEDEHKEGLLVLEEKKSGEVYSKQDIDVLKIFGPEVSVAINNAEAYEEISKFNITLKEEVEKATADLKSANEKLVGLDKLKDEFVYLASHELRTPMTAVKSYLWMTMQGDAGVLNDTQKLYLNRAYSSVERLIKLVNDMLNISRIESGRVTVEMQKVNIYQLTQEVVSEVQPRANELGVNVVVSPTSSLPDILADPDKIKEVLFNLIGNSLKFTSRDGTITISFNQNNDMLEVKVSDSGAGISPENLSKLFQKFSMLPDSYANNKSATGTGLGLYISRSIVELHKGKIWATSGGLGKGAQFYLSLKVFDEKDLKASIYSQDAIKKESVGIVHTQL